MDAEKNGPSGSGAASTGQTKRKLSGDESHLTSHKTSSLKKRMESISGVLGKEGNPLPQPGLHSGKCIGVFTSGGDSQGKNSMK